MRWIFIGVAVVTIGCLWEATGGKRPWESSCDHLARKCESVNRLDMQKQMACGMVGLAAIIGAGNGRSIEQRDCAQLVASLDKVGFQK